MITVKRWVWLGLLAMLLAVTGVLVSAETPPTDESHLAFMPLIQKPDYGLCYQEQGGIVIGEIEDAPAIDQWVPETFLPGYAGQTYYTWRGPDYFFPSQAGNAILRYAFIVDTAGEYKFRLHNRHLGVPTERNDAWTRIDEGPWIKTFSDDHLMWNWRTYYDNVPGGQNLDPRIFLWPGVHVLEISPRSEGFSLDRFTFYLSALGNAGEDLELLPSPRCN